MACINSGLQDDCILNILLFSEENSTMAKKSVSDDFDTWMDEYMEENNIDPCSETFRNWRCSIERDDVVPVRGSVYISTGRTVSEEEIDQLYKS
jgi:hypothetical protein